MPTLINIFKAGYYFFVPIEKITKGYRIRFEKNHQHLLKESRIVNSDGEIDYITLEEHGHTFKYEFEDKRREIDLKVFLIRHVCSINTNGRFYLVVGTGIDMVFKDGHLCNETDLIKLKKAFYERDREGLFYEIGDETIALRTWLDKKLEQIAGQEYKGKYGRHYIVNIQAVATSNQNNIAEQFAQEYYKTEINVPSYNEVLCNADKLAYSLLYGNDNISVIPDETVRDAFKDTYFNNKAEKLFAGGKTIVFLKTRHEKPETIPRVNRLLPLDVNIQGLINILDICMVMEAKHKLKSIQKMMRNNHPSEIKDALADMSQYLSKNPFRLSEIDKRTEYLYQTLGVKKLYDVVMKQGELLSEASNIRMNISINMRMYVLAGITLGVGGLDLLMSILCRNSSNQSSYMCNCLFGGAEPQSGCCAVVGVLFGLMLAACIITMLVFQGKSFYKLKNIEKSIRESYK